MWHWSNVSDDVLLACGFMSSTNAERLKRLNGRGDVREYGLDGIALDENGVYHGIQAKLWASTLCAHHLGTFFGVMGGRLQSVNNRSHGFLYHTTKLQIDVAEDIGLMPNISATYLPWSPGESIGFNECDLPLRMPQKHALTAMQSFFATSTTAGLVQMPCGVGKTAVAGHFLQHKQSQCVIIASPLRVHAKQALKRIAPFLPDYEALLIDSDIGATSAHIVQQPVKKTFISTTFDSLVFLKHIKAFLIIDEAHNMSAAMCDWVCERDSLLLTATPPVLLTQSSNVIFEYGMREAIDEGLICSYEVRLPLLEDIIIPDVLNSNQHTSCALFLVSGMLETGACKCILYCSTIADCKAMMETLTDVCHNYHGLEILCEVITADTGSSQRELAIKTFTSSVARIAVIASVRILNEGIDMPACDSVCFMSTTCSEITAIQRMCRANRKDPANPNKIAQVFIFSPYDECAGMLASLKHCDPLFETTIRMTSANYDQKDSREAKAKVTEQQVQMAHQVKIRTTTVEDRFDDMLNKVDVFIAEHGLPKREEEFYKWIDNNKHYYKKKIAIMRIPDVRSKWETFSTKHQILTYEERWRAKKEAQIKFWKGEVQEADPRWLDHTKQQYKAKRNIMARPEIRTEWEGVMDKFPQFFMTDAETFTGRCKEFISFIEENNRKPNSKASERSERSLGKWFATAGTRYRAKKFNMAKDEIRSMYVALITDIST